MSARVVAVPRPQFTMIVIFVFLRIRSGQVHLHTSRLRPESAQLDAPAAYSQLKAIHKLTSSQRVRFLPLFEIRIFFPVFPAVKEEVD
jgi:hypothetical protein